MIATKWKSQGRNVNNKEWFALAYKAVDALNELYQRVGAEHLEKTADQKQLTTGH